MTTDVAEHRTAPLRDFLIYFLRLGTFGFGGPVVLTGHMRSDLVDERRWIRSEEFSEALAFSQLCPGPLAAQLAMYLGWVRGGTLGATITGAVFILPSFLMTLAISLAYIHYGELPWIRGLFYSIGASVIGIMAKSAYTLARKTAGQDRVLWMLFTAGALYTVLTKSEAVWVFLLSGVIALFIKAPPRWNSQRTANALLPAWWLTGIHGLAGGKVFSNLVYFFLKSGAFVFGSGLAVVPFLYGGVVQKYHWLNEHQFLDAVAVGMITPGPVVITSAFIGYLTAGPMGAIIAAFCIFFPVYLFVVLLAPFYHRFAHNAQVRAFVSGVTSSAVGGIAGAVYVLGRNAVIDLPTSIIALATLVIVLKFKRLPEAVIVLVAGLVGTLL